MKYRTVAAILKAAGCTSRPAKGDHEVWICPCGKHKAAITRPGEISAGLVRDVIKKFTCMPEGWLQ